MAASTTSRVGFVSLRCGAFFACALIFSSPSWAGPQTSAKGSPRTLGDVIQEGGELFARQWVANDTRSHGGDGLGPVYNEASCVACHGQGGPGGAGPANKNAVLLSAPPPAPSAKKRDWELEKIHPGFRDARSLVFHRSGTSPKYAFWKVRFFDGEDLIDRPESSLPPLTPLDTALMGTREDPTGARMSEHQKRALSSQFDLKAKRAGLARFARNRALSLSERNAPPLFGAGLIDAVPVPVLEAMAESQPRRIRGRVNRMKDGQAGRFGWKAQTPTLREFVYSACANELGLEVTDHHQTASPLAFESVANGLDLSDDEVNALVIYIQFLPQPVVVEPIGAAGSDAITRGGLLFASIGCASCHARRLGDVEGIYSDLLLHDMGQSLSDSGNYYAETAPDSPGLAKSTEWRTPPLWGYRDSGPYLHDGRARSLPEAVAFHQGQGAASADRFFGLSPLEQFYVNAFLKSLVAPSTAKKSGELLVAQADQDAERRQLEADERIGRQIYAAFEAERSSQREENDRIERKRRAEFESRLAVTRLKAARALETLGKTEGALDFYREVVKNFPDSEPGKIAARRIEALGKRP